MLLLLMGLVNSGAAKQPTPKLVLLIVVDQLRGDLPHRMHERLGRGGFNLLFDSGLWYSSAHHPHSHTETVVGHSTISTGAYPSRHGMIGNSWIDPQTGEKVKCFEEEGVTLVGAKGKGSTPNQLLATTFGDELVLSNNGRSRAYGVSVKNRAAVALAGHAGKAFWFDLGGGSFVSSSFYFNKLPAWVSNWNLQGLADQFAGKEWTLSRAKETYLYADITPIAEDMAGYGSTFPHPYGQPTDPEGLYYYKLTTGPVGDELVLKFAKELIKQEKLGQNGVTDYLGLSFSATDMIGHVFSQTSLEIEDNLLQLDLHLENLFQFIEAQPNLGLENTLVVLTGDHGGPEIPTYLQQLKINTGRIDPALIEKEIKKELKKRFGRDDLIFPFKAPYVYFKHDVIEQAKLSPSEVARAVSKGAMSVNGIAIAVHSAEGARRSSVDTELRTQIIRNQNPKRSGDVYVVQSPNWIIDEEAHEPNAPLPTKTIHGSPWTYDTHVPVFFAGNSVFHGIEKRKILTTDLAATLAAYLKIKPPSACTGKPLPEVLGAPSKGK